VQLERRPPDSRTRNVPATFALREMTAVDEARIGALVKQAVS
jgi:hypothetical protein